MIFPDPTGQFKYRVNSFSGNEPNRFFLRNGNSYLDLSTISGVDHRGDGRGFALFDFDKDGFQDIALISTNAPRLQIYRNRLGDFFPDNRVLRVRLVGSQRSSRANPARTNRDAVGSKLFVMRKSGARQMQHRQIGEGNVAQNSSWVWIPQPEEDPAVKLEVVWTSGQRSEVVVGDDDKELTIDEPVVSGPVQ